jgi:acyl-coenzyme A thioesterase PaaI-like protein
VASATRSSRDTVPVDATEPQGSSGLDEFTRLVEEVEQVADLLATVAPDPDVFASCATTLERAAQLLRQAPATSGSVDPLATRTFGGGLSVRDRGMAPVFTIASQTDRQLAGQVSFPPRFQGFSAVHGGFIAVLFDELLGHHANSVTSVPAAVSRTASLTVTYRALTPIDQSLACSAELVRRDGRKLWMRGALHHDGNVLATAEGLWIEQRITE